MYNEKNVNLAREYAYSQFTADERKLIEETDPDYCFDSKVVGLINQWFSIYQKKLKELNSK